MEYKTLVDSICSRTGLPRNECEDALQLFVEAIAVRLSERDRRLFAAHLPDPLHDIALSVWSSSENTRLDFFEQFVSLQHVGRNKAKKEIEAVWQSLKSLVTPRQRDFVRSLLPKRMAKSLA